MGSLSGEESRFFDAHEDITSISDANSDIIETLDSPCGTENSFPNSSHYELWVRSPKSVDERRSKFLNWMGVGLDQSGNENSAMVSCVVGESDRFRDNSGAVLRTLPFEDEFCSTRSTMSCWSSDNSSFHEELGLRERTSDGGMVCTDELSLEQSVTAEDSDNTYRLSTSFKQLLQMEIAEQDGLAGTSRSEKKGWFRRLRSIACVVDKQLEAEKLRQEDDDLMQYGVQRVKVRQCGKRAKELSALYKGQDIQAHEGSILSMKFSPDGQYLASAGEDKIVRVWQVLEDERSNDFDIPEIDPSCIYFTVNHLSELKPLFVDKEKAAKLRSLRKTSNSACIIFPPKVFRLSERPLHEFHGHSGEILDLSWSEDHHLLSASEDKTVRLWQVGSDCCLRIFSHSNYVSCVQFNPVDNNYFMSGSIDGKVRIWAISISQVVDWTDVKEIVTAVCYHPDGQGGIVGSIGGNCRFYNMSDLWKNKHIKKQAFPFFFGSDSHLQLEAQICFNSKKKSPCKRITGFQFCPQDPSKVMVTCADSQVRILQGLNVIYKYRGVKNTASLISASFTSDGKHIVSACEDSNVYFWNCIDHARDVPTQAKTVRSCERFSTNVSVAIPWCGLKHGNSENGGFQLSNDNSAEVMPFSSPAGFSLSQEYFLESFPKGSATWPEEKLPPASPVSTSPAMHRSHYKFLKASCQSTAASHAWGLVIVTAGWDGRIRSFRNYGLPVPV